MSDQNAEKAPPEPYSTDATVDVLEALNFVVRTLSPNAVERLSAGAGWVRMDATAAKWLLNARAVMRGDPPPFPPETGSDS